MALRDYQAEAADRLMEDWREHASSLIVLPTGCGKTVLFAEVIRRMQPRRAMVLAHREELIFQARDKIHRFTGLEAEVEMGDYRATGLLGMLPSVVVSTVQTQTAGGDGQGRMSKFLPDDFGLLVIDEAHHAVSATYRRCIDWYRQNPDLKILGVTATPDRADEEALGQVFESVAYDYEILDAINDGWLVPVEQQVVEVGSLDFSSCRTTAGDLNGADLAAVMEAEQNLHGIASPTLDIAGDRRALVFAASVEQAERLAEIFNRSRPGSAAFVCGKTPKDERRKLLGDFKAGAVQFVVNVGVLTEGFDDAGVELVVMARPTKSRALYAQMAGRAIRPADSIANSLGSLDVSGRRSAIASSSKPKCLIVDFAGNAGRHKLVNSCDILGGKVSDEVLDIARAHLRESGKPLDVSEAIDEAQKELQKRKMREAAQRAAIVARTQYTMQQINPFDAWDITPAVERGWDRGKHLSEKQAAILRKQGIDPDGLPYSQAKQLLNELFRRWHNNESASLRMSRLLQRNHLPMPLRKDEASRLVGVLKERQGWQ
jgi:superfamily II DNA or RNA helicase